MTGLEVWSSWATIVGAVVSITAVPVALVQVARIKKSQFAEVRPYVEVGYVTVNRDKSTRIYIEFKNVGKTPGKNVKLTFLNESKWNYVLKPDYPFLSSNGIHRIQSGESIKFFVGELGANQEFDLIREKRIPVNLQYETVFSGKKIVEQVDLSLSHLRYSKNLKVKSSQAGEAT